MFEALVPDEFFEDEDEESYNVLESCNISDAFEDDKEKCEEEFCISPGFT